eukprot:5996549-Heterocapsa_arctica.AAC.1
MATADGRTAAARLALTRAAMVSGCHAVSAADSEHDPASKHETSIIDAVDVDHDATPSSTTARQTTWKDERHGGLNTNHKGNALSELNRHRQLCLTTIEQAAESATSEKVDRDDVARRGERDASSA